MNTYIIYFVSVINCYVSAQLIFDHFKINFNSIYSQKWIYNIVTISVGALIGIINLFNYPILNFGLSFLHLLYAYYFMIHGVQRKLYSWIYTFSYFF